MERIYIPIGCDCEATYWCADNKFRKDAYPFDWLVSPLSSICDIIKNDFVGFLEDPYILRTNHRQLYIDKGKRMSLTHVYCKKSKLFFIHDFRSRNDFTFELNLVREKFNRRIQRFKDVCNSKNEVIFVCDKSTNHIHTESINYLLTNTLLNKTGINIPVRILDNVEDTDNLSKRIEEFKSIISSKYPKLIFSVVQV